MATTDEIPQYYNRKVFLQNINNEGGNREHQIMI